MSDYLLQMIEVQASVITDLTEVNKRLLLELEQYRAIEEEDNIILTMIQELDKHNNVAERVYKLEADSKVVFEKISVENNRIKDLEGWQKHEQEKE